MNNSMSFSQNNGQNKNEGLALILAAELSMKYDSAESSWPYDNKGEPIFMLHLEIKKNIQNLIKVLWADEVALDDNEVSNLYQLYLDLILIGKQHRDSKYKIGNQTKTEQEDYVVRAWVEVIHQMIGDQKRVYD